MELTYSVHSYFLHILNTFFVRGLSNIQQPKVLISQCYGRGSAEVLACVQYRTLLYRVFV